MHIDGLYHYQVESLAIDMKLKEVEKVLYFESFIVVEPGLTNLKKVS